MKITGIRLHEVRPGLVTRPYRSARNTISALTHAHGCMFVHDDSPGLGCEPRPDSLGPCVARFG